MILCITLMHALSLGELTLFSAGATNDIRRRQLQRHIVASGFGKMEREGNTLNVYG